MRPRKWVLIFACCTLSLALALLYGKRSLERNRNLENLLVEAVGAAIKGNCTVEAVRIGFLSVNLKNVTLSLPLQSLSLSIRNIRIGISFSRLVESRGDIPRSINQIIIIGPRLDIILPQTDTAGAAAAFASRPRMAASPASAAGAPPTVQFASVKDGRVRLLDHRGDTIELAHDLSGTLSNVTGGMTISVGGQSGSSKKNISLRGDLSWPANEHHFSLRISDALLSRPFTSGALTISTGNIDGALECTFTNSFSPDSMDLHGWLDITSGTASFAAVPARLDSIHLRIVPGDGSCRITLVDAMFNGLHLDALGDCRFIGNRSLRMKATCKKFAPAALLGLIPDSLLRELSGIGTLDASLELADGIDPAFTFSGRNFSVHDLLLKNLDVAGRLSEKRIIADSVTVVTPYFSSRLHGFYEHDSLAPVYDAAFSVSVDSLPDSLAINGSLSMMGAFASDTGGHPTASARVLATDLKWRQLTLGEQQFVANLSDGRCTFGSVAASSGSAISISGTIDSLFSGQPKAQCELLLESTPIKEQLKRIHGVPPVDSAACSIRGDGWINDFSATAELYLRTTELSGTVTAYFERKAPDTAALAWKLGSNDMHYKTATIPFEGRGVILDSVIRIDTLAGYGGVSAGGRIFYGSSPARVSAKIRYDLPVARITPFLSDMRGGPDSGTVRGTTTIEGPIDSLQTKSNVKIRNFGTDAIAGFSTDLTVLTAGPVYTLLPTIVKRGTYTIISLDTISNAGGPLRLRGDFSNVTPRTLLGPLIAPEIDIESFMSGSITTTADGFPLEFNVEASYFEYDTIHLDSLRCRGLIDEKTLTVTRIDFCDANRSKGYASFSIPWSMLGEDATDLDTLRGDLHLNGDLLATIESNVKSPIAGTGQGTADISFTSAGGIWNFTTGNISLPTGTLRLRPFVLDDIKSFTFRTTIDSNAVVHTDMSGTIRHRPIRIFSTHDIPYGYEPLMIGPLNLGMFQVVTPKKGVDLHLPGFMALKERGDIEFRGKKPFDHFTISGPLDKLKLTGVWVLRDVEFTFPFLPNDEMLWDFDPFPFVTWEMDIIPGNRKAMYFWELTGKRNRLMRFLEAYLDPSSLLKVRGRDQDKTFRLYGSIRSYKGAVYYGRTFDRNVDIGVDFYPQKPDPRKGYDNLPVIWGSAEAFSDSTRQNRIKLTCMVNDSVTGGISERGRLIDAPTPNITFHLSSDYEELPGESEREYYRRAGITFSTFSGAGNAVSGIGEQMFHQFLLQRWERLLAKKLGLDVMNIETSLVSNYFNKLYSRQFDGLLNQEDYLALANVGVTVGRYFFRDYFLLKARGELVPIDLALTPEYSVGLEFQPSRYLTMDVNYGFHMNDGSVVHNPQLVMQLRLPINRIRNLFKF